MRIYRSFSEAYNELKRDVAELGINVHPQTMQDKQIADDPEYETREYPNMIYTVTKPDLDDAMSLVPVPEWVDAEFYERIHFFGQHDGTAWELRPEVWK